MKTKNTHLTLLHHLPHRWQVSFHKAFLRALAVLLSVLPHVRGYSHSTILPNQENCRHLFSINRQLKSKIFFLKTYTGSARAYYYLMHDNHQLKKLKSISLKQLQKNLHWIEGFVNSSPGRKGKGHFIVSEFLNHGLLNPHVFLAKSKELSHLSHSIKAHIKNQTPTVQEKLKEQFISHILMGNQPLSDRLQSPVFKKPDLRGKHH